MTQASNMSFVSANDALPLEYKLLNRQPLRQVDVSHFIGDAALQSFLRVDECHLKEEAINGVCAHRGVPNHDVVSKSLTWTWFAPRYSTRWHPVLI